MRLYRERALEFELLAESEPLSEVRLRYRIAPSDGAIMSFAEVAAAVPREPGANAAWSRQPNRARPLLQNGFAPDQGVEPAMPLFHLGARSVVRTHYRGSNSESVERIERPGAI
jgi:hypothetical protein